MSLFSGKDDICAFLKEPCIKTRCHFWKPELVNPNPKENPNLVEEQFDCEIHWMVVHMRQFAYQQNSTSAAMESLRNESVNNAKMVAMGIAGAIKETLQDRLKLQEHKQ